MVYNPWPIGNLPEKWQRPELLALKKNGYSFEDAREVVGIFERKLADYAGSKFAIAVDSASSGIFLSLKYFNQPQIIKIPKKTYISVPMQILHAGYSIGFEDQDWTGIYQLKPLNIFDSAARFTPDMYVGGNSLQIISFQIKKRIPIGRGGAILTDDSDAYNWLKLASYDGRDLNSPYDDKEHVKQIGWHMYMTPEDAGRGILLMDMLGTEPQSDIAGASAYPDVTNWLSRIENE